MSEPVLIALIDGPLADDHPALKQRIALAEGAAHPAAGRHAEALAAAMMLAAPDVQIVNLQIFGAQLATSAAQLVQALRLAAEQQTHIVHCSFGLTRKDEEMASAVTELQDLGASLVAAAPARGAATYPAALPGVLSVQGDARCRADEWSHLDLPTALFGAHALSMTSPEIRGASVAAAYLSGFLAARLGDGSSRGAAVAALRQEARFQGRERRLK